VIVCALSLLLTAAPLVEAVKHQDKAAVRALLRQRVDVNAPEADGATALHWAAYEDDEEIVDLLIAAGARVNVANDLAIAPLYLASANGNAAIVKRLLEKGAAANAAAETGVTPLMQAARSGNVDVVRELLSHGADVDARERDRGQTALMWAVARQHPGVVKILVAHHADVHARTRTRNVTVMLDQGPRRSVKTAMQDARQMEAGGSTPLIFAALVGDAESAGLLLAAGADKDEAAADGNRALVIAALGGHAAVASALLEAGADPNANGAGYTALHAAVLRSDHSTVKALLARGANPNARLTKGSPVRRFGSQWALPSTLAGATPLLVAAAYLETDIMRALLAAGADHTLGLSNGTTPLLAAAGSSVEKEARPSDLVRWNVVDSDAPVVPRAEADVVDATRLLLDAGADVNQANEAGDAALHAAAAAGMTDLIQLLADRGASVNITNKAGQTPLSLTLPRSRQQDGRPSAVGAGSKPAEALLRKLGAAR
jgi:ankyrin repeat protein